MLLSLISAPQKRRPLVGIAILAVIVATGLPWVPALRGATQNASFDPCRPQPATDSAALLVEKSWASAALAHDSRTLACIIDSSFVDIDWRGGVRTRDMVLTAPPAAPSKYRQSIGDLTVQRARDIAIVRGMNTISDSTGLELQHIRFTDVLRYVNQRWRAVSAQETMVREEQKG